MRRKNTIVLVEDDLELNNLLSNLFINQGFEVHSLREGKNAIETVLEVLPDFVLLDGMLPQISGERICKELREKGVLSPIFLLSAKIQDDYKINAFLNGVSGYLEKPINPLVLLAIVQNKIAGADKPLKEPVHEFQDFTHFPDRNILMKLGKRDYLTKFENKILDFFCKNLSKIITKEQLSLEIWEHSLEPGSNLLNMHLSRLRKKIEIIPKFPKTLRSIRGKGILFTPRPFEIPITQSR